jgi:hypothetical protein
MTQEYTPTTDEVRRGFRADPSKYEYAETPEYIDENWWELNKLAHGRPDELAAHDAQVRAEAVLSAFHYDDYESEDGEEPRLRLGDYVYAFCELPPNMGEVCFHAHIVNFSDDYRGVKPTPAFKILDSEGEERYASILECAMQGYSFILVNKQSVAEHRKETVMNEYLEQLNRAY